MSVDAEYLRASNGIGPAAKATVSQNRSIGDMDIITDTVQNWPAKGIATSGTPVGTTSVLDPATIKVFKFVLTGSIIHIQSFAPGYTDAGNTINQVVVLKPTTEWADYMVNAFEDDPSISIGSTAPSAPAMGDLWGDTSGTAVTTLAAAVGNLLMPVGFYYINETDSTNPGTSLGFGTWVAVEGYTIVGHKASGTFNVAGGTTGGEETHTLSIAEMPSHNHTLSNTWNTSGSILVASGTYRWYNDVTSTTSSSGGDGAHNNLQPYVVAYVWKRTA